MHGHLLSSGGFFSVDVPGALQTTVNGIIDPGEIAGRFVDTTGKDARVRPVAWYFHGL